MMSAFISASQAFLLVLSLRKEKSKVRVFEGVKVGSPVDFKVKVKIISRVLIESINAFEN